MISPSSVSSDGTTATHTLVTVDIDTAQAHDGSHTDCQGHLGSQEIMFDNPAQKLEAGQRLVIVYDHFDALGRDGVIESDQPNHS